MKCHQGGNFSKKNVTKEEILQWNVIKVEFLQWKMLTRWTFWKLWGPDFEIWADVENMQVGDPDEVFGQDDEVVAEVLNAKEQKVAS